MTSPAREPSGRVAGDVVAYLLAGNDPGRNPGSPDSRSRVGRRQLEGLRLELSRRDLAVLSSLSMLHYATSKQLQRLHFDMPDSTPRQAAQRTVRALNRLHRLGTVDRHARRVGGPFAGSAPNLWRLSPAGSRLLDETPSRSREPGLAHLTHELAVGELVVRLHEAARSGSFEILRTETQPACWQSYTGQRRRPVWLKPDLRVTLRSGGYRLHWFVEIDRSTEHRPTLERKIHAYQVAWRDAARQAEARVFPRVLWAVPDERRAAVLTDLCGSATGTPVDLFAVAVWVDAVDVLIDSET